MHTTWPSTTLAWWAMGAAPSESALLSGGAAQTTLLARDRSGDNVVDVFCDTDLFIAWLRDANVNGPMEWDTAVGLSDGGGSDWWLPTTGDICARGFCAGSQMGHHWRDELGIAFGGHMTDTGG